MRRVFGYWLALAPVAFVVSYATSLAGFRAIDLTFAQFTILVVVPLLQAAALAWEMSRPWPRLAALPRVAMRAPLAPPFLLIDALVLGAGLLLWNVRTAGLGADYSIHAAWAASKAAAAAVCFVTMWHRERRGVVLLAALVLALTAAAPYTGWVASTFSALRTVRPLGAEIIERIVFFTPLVAVAIAILLRAGRVLGRRHPHAETLCETAAAFAIAAAVPIVLVTFNLPVVVQPWRGFALLGASLAATMMLLAGLVSVSTAPAPKPEGAAV